MSLSKKRHARKNTRTTLSGKRVPATTEFPANPDWSQIVQPQPKQPPVIRDGIFYADVVDALPKPEDLKVVEHPHTGTNREQRRTRLRGKGILGMYTKDLHFQMGKAKADHWEAKRLMRLRAAEARLAEKFNTFAA